MGIYNWSNNMTFERWWKEKYEGKFPTKVLEEAFKEIARNAWITAIHLEKSER